MDQRYIPRVKRDAKKSNTITSVFFPEIRKPKLQITSPIA
jgi:hypothetical protein